MRLPLVPLLQQVPWQHQAAASINNSSTSSKGPPP
jgi:hypothetical protein